LAAGEKPDSVQEDLLGQATLFARRCRSLRVKALESGMEDIDDNDLNSGSPPSKSDDLKYTWDAGLTDDEYGLIGAIVAQWGALEAEVFGQTLMTFGTDVHVNDLPKAMNNMRFADVLNLWNERVVGKAEGDAKQVLQNAYEKVLKLQDFRNAMVHGMWQFNLSAPKTITAVRVKRNMLISTVFDHESLFDFLDAVERLNFDIRYPQGSLQYFEEIFSGGSYFNEAAFRRLKLGAQKG
jgi:hypothetical protein